MSQKSNLDVVFQLHSNLFHLQKTKDSLLCNLQHTHTHTHTHAHLLFGNTAAIRQRHIPEGKKLGV